MKPLVLLSLLVLMIIPLAMPASAELVPLVTIDPRADDPGLRSVESIAYDGDCIYLGVSTGPFTNKYEGGIMVYDGSGRLINKFPAYIWPGQLSGSTITPTGLCMNGSNVMALDGNLIITYDGGGKVLSRQHIARLDMGSLVPQTGPFVTYNTTVSVASDGAHVYVYRGSNGMVQKIANDGVLVAEYPFAPDSGPMIIRGNEVWASDKYIAGKTLVLSSDLKKIREFTPGVANLALYDDMVLTSSYKDLAVRDAGFKVIKSAEPLPANCYIYRMAAGGGKVAIVGYNMTRVNNKSVNEHKVYLYDLAQVAPRGNPVSAPAASPHALAAPPAVEWEQQYGGPGNQAFYSLAGTGEGYVMAGSIANGLTSSKAYVVKADRQGKLAWQQTLDRYPGATVMSVMKAADGSYIVAGYANVTGVDAYLAKLGENGGVIWEKVFGGPGDERLFDVRPAGSGGYAVAGYSVLPGGAEPRMYFALVDASGNVTSSRTYGINAGGASMTEAGDGGYVIAGGRDNLIYLVKVDRNGELVWEKAHKAAASSPSCSGSRVIRTVEGGYAVAGRMIAPASGQTFTVNSDAVLLKADANGNKEWSRLFDFVYADGNSDNAGIALGQAADGGYVLAGYTLLPKNESTGKWKMYDHMMYVVKTDHNGLLQWRAYPGENVKGEGRSMLVDDDGSYLIAGKRGDQKDEDAYLVKLAPGHLGPTVTARATPGSAGSVTPAGGQGGSSCCAAAVLPLLIVGTVLVAQRRKGGRD